MKSLPQNSVAYLFIFPAALTLLSRVSDEVGLSELLHRLLRVWRAASHAFWDWLGTYLNVIFPFRPTPNQMDGLTLICLLLGAAMSPWVLARAKRLLRNAEPTGERQSLPTNLQTRALFTLSLVVFCGAFAAPYFDVVLSALRLDDPPYDVRRWLLAIFGVGIVVLGVGLVTFDKPERFAQHRQWQAFTCGGLLAMILMLDWNAAASRAAAFDAARAQGAAGGLQPWSGFPPSAQEALGLVGIIALAVAFVIAVTRAPQSIIRLVATGVGLVLADQLLRLANLEFPAALEWLERLESSVETRPTD